MAEGKLQRAERYRQVALMPAPPGQGGFPAVISTHRQLGSARSTIACAHTQMVLSSTRFDRWKYWKDIHEQASFQARMHHARYHAELVHGAGWWARASNAEREDYRTRAMSEADFTTPAEPMRLVEVLEHHIVKHDPALADGRGVDPMVDSPSWARWRGVGEGNKHDLHHLEQQAYTMLTGLVKTDPSPAVVGCLVESMLDDDPVGWAVLKLIFSRRKLETT